MDWAAAAAELGCEYPDDYRMLADVYGPGVFADTWSLLLPGIGLNSGPIEMATFHDSLLETRRSRFAFQMHPATGGLLPWGMAVEQDIPELHWVTGGQDANQWPCVAHDWDGLHIAYMGASVTETLVALLTESSGFPLVPAFEGTPAFRASW